MIPFEYREAIMKKMSEESFEGVEAEYIGNATVDIIGAEFRLTEFGSLMCTVGDNTSCFGFYPDPEDTESTVQKFRMIVAWRLGVDYRER